MNNDLIVTGEEAARAFVRGTKGLKELIEPMALGLAEARKRYPSDPLFGAWRKESAYSQLNRNDLTALIKLGENWDDDLAARFDELDSYSPELIARKLLSDNLTEEDDDDEDEDEGSGLYGERISRSNEAWDTLDPRLTRSLIEAVPHLTKRMVWEPAAGRGLMVDQLEEGDVKVFAATDIEPRRGDIAKFDLLSATAMRDGTDAIVTNPPWGRLAAPFVRHCLTLAQQKGALVAMLLPLPWIAGRKIADMTGSEGFDALIVPRYRARWMTPEEEAELKDGPSAPKMNHVWLVWDFARNPLHAPRIDFVDAPADTEVDAEDEEMETVI